MMIFIKYLSIFTAAVLFCSCTITPYSIGEKWAQEDISKNIIKYKIRIPDHNRIQGILLYTKYQVTEYFVAPQITSEDFSERLWAYNHTVNNYLKQEYGFDVFYSSQKESENITAQILKSCKTIDDFLGSNYDIHNSSKYTMNPMNPIVGGESISQLSISKFTISKVTVKPDTTHPALQKISNDR